RVGDAAALPPRQDLGLPDDTAEQLVEGDEIGVARRRGDLALTDRDAGLATAGAHVERGIVGRHPVPDLLARRRVEREDVALRSLDVVDAVGDDCIRLERATLRIL